LLFAALISAAARRLQRSSPFIATINPFYLPESESVGCDEAEFGTLNAFYSKPPIRGKLTYIQRNQRADHSLNESAQIKPHAAEPGEIISFLPAVKFDRAFNETGFAAGSVRPEPSLGNSERSDLFTK
jgi:hypothetical protein